MRTITQALTLTLALGLCTAVTSCKKKDGETTDPEEGSDEKQDPVEALKQVPADIQGEIDLVLKPITDGEKLMTDIETAPERLKISVGDLKGMLKAAFDADVKADAEGASVDVNVDLSALDVTAEARAELQSMIGLVRDIKTGLLATPETVVVATKNIVGHGARATGLATKATASIQAKLTFAQGDKKAELEQQLQDIQTLTADIQTTVTDAKATVTELPAKATEMGANLAASFAASAG